MASGDSAFAAEMKARVEAQRLLAEAEREARKWKLEAERQQALTAGARAELERLRATLAPEAPSNSG